jgi:putative Mg2+ transporter-C (MgtC) family protein
VLPLDITWSEISLRLALALAAGTLIGLNRSVHGHEAGLRTTILVTLAAAVTMIQVNLLLGLTGKAPNSFIQLDLMRLPLGILSGMGFIGGGAILHKQNMVVGVTTAATLWFSTVIGLCFGGGQLKLGLAALALTTVVLWLFRKLEYFLPQDHDGVLTLLTESLKEDDLRAQLAKANYQVLSSELTYMNHKQSQLRMRIRWRKPARDSSPPAFINELASSPQIQNLHWEPQ